MEECSVVEDLDESYLNDSANMIEMVMIEENGIVAERIVECGNIIVSQPSDLSFSKEVE